MKHLFQRWIAALLGMCVLLLPGWASVSGVSISPCGTEGVASVCCVSKAVSKAAPCCASDCCVDSGSRQPMEPVSVPAVPPVNPLPDWLPLIVSLLELPAPVADRVPAGTMVLRGRHDPSIPLFLRDRLLLI